MSKRKSSTQLAKFAKNTENPFLKEALEVINNNVVKKYKTASNTGESAILHAVDTKTGELKGHTQFIRQIEVDDEQFTKIYLSQFKAFFDLKPQAIKVFGYIMTRLNPKQDMFVFLMYEALNYTGYKSEESIRIGLGALVASNIIARGPADTLYFINPMVAFNGDRVTFAKSYVKKSKSIPNPNQLEIDF
jgi:hypothetical protein